MARRVLVLADWDCRAKPGVVVAYLAGWSGLVPEAHFAAAPAGRFEELPRHGESEPRTDAEDPVIDPEGDP